MIENLKTEYPKRIHNLLTDVNKLFKDKSFGAHKNIIGLTAPFMILEKWRENGHASDIPLLDESVKNVVVATATLLFGWTKTSCLHLRVALENIFTGSSLLMNSRTLKEYNVNGIISYKRFKDSVNDYEKGSMTFANISDKFGIKTDALNLYADLSNWSHTLGNDFICDLSILGYSKMNNTTIGKMKAHYQKLARISSIVYLSVRPNIFQDISPSNQRLFLRYISKEERKLFREMIGL
ncbi:MAG: hypothetical protein ABFD75_10545 [Smithella sp.]